MRINKQLVETIANRMLETMEVNQASDYIDQIQCVENDLGVEFSAEDILSAWREAGEYAVESFICNERETSGLTESEREKNIQRWESMRPSVIRSNAIRAMLVG